MQRHLLFVVSVLLPVYLTLGTVEYCSILPSRIYANKEKRDTLTFKQLHRPNNKKVVLEQFFEKFNSPLKPYAGAFVDAAEKYNLDYKLLPSISCIESSCGKKLIPGTNNPFGWGIYGSNVITFSTYSQAIDTVGKGLKENYISKGYNTIEKIAPVYTPPNYISWESSVSFFNNKIAEIENTL